MESVIQRQFHNACRDNNLEKVKETLINGAKMTGLGLGLAGSFPASYEVFEYLATNNCPIDGNTWLYLRSSENAHLLVDKLFSSKRDGMTIIIQAAIAGCMEPNMKLLGLAIERIGMQDKFFLYLAMGGNPSNEEQLTLFKQILFQMRAKPNALMLEWAKSGGNKYIINYINDCIK